MNTIEHHRILQVLNIINSLRTSDFFIEHIFMRGGCYKFYLFLKTIYPNAVPYINQEKDHVTTLISGRLFDIRGMIETQFEELYTPLKDEDLGVVSSWSFSKNQVLQLCECPFCGEPIIYDTIN